MKLSNIPIGFEIICNDNTAIILKHGIMGCRVNVTKSKFDSTIVGFQLWSNYTECTLNAHKGGKIAILPQININH